MQCYCIYSITDECMHCTGEDYRGNISITENKHTCQRWDTQEPHSHVFNPSIHPEMHLVENFCRNPNGGRQPWCYTTDPSIQWEYCVIPRCSSEPPTIIPELTCATGNGEAYRGTNAMTESGKTCQYWLDQSEHTPQNYPCKGLDNNYCRNPDQKERPWCYTTDPETPWEYCDVPSCQDGDGPESPREEEDCYVGDGSSYRGITSETISGKRCQDWSSMTPHSHNYTQQNYPKG
ncbi:plasminogen-like, partial [Plectropomus leopardus]|uniref:plasminogen-like n=1 Tax=Plectropomus leopardus TaxID=160734 RepID=UPI001C4BE309